MTHAARTQPQGPDTSETLNAAAPHIRSADDAGSGEDRSVLALPARLRDSVWWPVVARSAAVAATLGALALVGAASARAGTGVPVEAPTDARDRLEGVWVAPTPSAAAQDAPSAMASPPVAEAPAAASARPSDPQEPGTEEPPRHSASGGGSTSGVTTDGKVVLNEATADELCRLPRVGPKRADAIVALRTRLGRFRNPSDLLRVRGIGTKTLRQMLPHLVLDAPRAVR